MDFYEAIEKRRSYYDIINKSTISDDRIKEIITQAVKYSPSAYNSKSSRTLVLLGRKHKKLWDITLKTLRSTVPELRLDATENKISSFANGYGTVLFFEDTEVKNELNERFPLYKENFKIWAQQANGMLQYAVWVSLEIEGLGASLQHYNPIIDEEVKKVFKIPQSWQLIAQMPFGVPSCEPGEKNIEQIIDSIKVLK